MDIILRGSAGPAYPDTELLLRLPPGTRVMGNRGIVGYVGYVVGYSDTQAESAGWGQKPKPVHFMLVKWDGIHKDTRYEAHFLKVLPHFLKVLP